MSPAAPRKPASDELIELTEVAEDESPDNPGGRLNPENVDASFEQELEELFSEDVGQSKKGKASALADEDDALLLEDVAEPAQGEDDALLLEDVAEPAPKPRPAKPAPKPQAVAPEGDLDFSGLDLNLEVPEEKPQAVAPEGDLDFSGLDQAIDDMTGKKAVAPAPKAPPIAPEGDLDLDSLLDDVGQAEAAPVAKPAAAKDEDEFGALSLDDLVGEQGEKKEEGEEVVGLDELLADAEGEAHAAPAAQAFTMEEPAPAPAKPAPAKPAPAKPAPAKPAPVAAPAPAARENLDDLLAAVDIDVSDIVAGGQHPEVSGAPASSVDVDAMLDEIAAGPEISAEAVQALEERLAAVERKPAAIEDKLNGLAANLSALDRKLAALDQRLAGLEPGLKAEIAKAVPAEAARIIREEIAALSREIVKG